MALNFEDHKDRYQGAVVRYKLGEITEDVFSQILAALGYNATEIKEEILQCKRESEDGV